MVAYPNAAAIAAAVTLTTGAASILVTQHGSRAVGTEVVMGRTDLSQGEGAGTSEGAITDPQHSREADKENTGGELARRSIHSPGVPGSPEDFRVLKERAQRSEEESVKHSGQQDEP